VTQYVVSTRVTYFANLIVVSSISLAVDPTTSPVRPIEPNETGQQCFGRASHYAEVPAPKAFRHWGRKAQWPQIGAIIAFALDSFKAE
jgi:hypothetical protein